MDTRPKLKRDWRGRLVRTLKEMRNGWGVIPAGTVLTVDENRAGLRLSGESCATCGMQPTINRVREHDITLLPKDYTPPARQPSPSWPPEVVEAVAGMMWRRHSTDGTSNQNFSDFRESNPIQAGEWISDARDVLAIVEPAPEVNW